MTERTTVRLEEGLLREAKKKAAEEGRTLTSLIEEGLRAVVHGGQVKGEPQKFDLPVSKERGGLILPPHVDPTKTSEILEYLDSFLPPEKWR